MNRYKVLNSVVISITLMLITLNSSSQTETKPHLDALKKIVPDNYPITDSMLAHNMGKWGDYCWFKNEELNQTIVIQLYTDYHRLYIYHFYSTDIPSEIVEQMELHTMSGELANGSEKLQIINANISDAESISDTFFVSNKAMTLGVDIHKTISKLGQPLHIYQKNEFEIINWNYEGDILHMRSTIKNMPLAMNSFGYSSTTIFKDHKLVGYIIHNAVP